MQEMLDKIKELELELKNVRYKTLLEAADICAKWYSADTCRIKILDEADKVKKNGKHK
jgi:hypothetical protein